MLVITRKLGDSVLIGDDIEIVVSDVGAEKVKLAISAPRSVKILRKELFETEKMNKEAANSSEAASVSEFAEAMKGGVKLPFSKRDDSTS